MPIICESVEDLKKGSLYGPDDVFSVTFPKSGSTWSQEMIWLLNNDLDYKSATEVRIGERFPHIEFDICFKNLTLDTVVGSNKLASPRHLKSHLPAGLLPTQIWTVKPKIIYIARSSKDNAVSYFYHYNNFHFYRGSKLGFMEAYLDDQIIFSPQHGHIKDFWFMRTEENILFLTFEEMKRDLFDVLKRTSAFLNTLYTDAQLRELEQFLSFESMKARENKERLKLEMKMFAELQGVEENLSQNPEFLRKGAVGSPKEEMPADLINRFDERTKQFNKDNDTNILP